MYVLAGVEAGLGSRCLVQVLHHTERAARDEDREDDGEERQRHDEQHCHVATSSSNSVSDVMMSSTAT